MWDIVDRIAGLLLPILIGVLLLLTITAAIGCSAPAWPPVVTFHSGGGSGYLCLDIEGHLVCGVVSEDSTPGQHCVRGTATVESGPWGTVRVSGLVPGSSDTCAEEP